MVCQDLYGGDLFLLIERYCDKGNRLSVAEEVRRYREGGPYRNCIDRLYRRCAEG